MNINTKGISAVTASITDYDIISPSLARVIVAFTGKPSAAEVTETLARQMGYAAAPVENSFRMLKENVAIGYVRANREVRPVDENQIRAGYRVMASGAGGNILMSNDDSTLWEVKKGAAGMFLARQGQEDLSALVHAAVNHRPGVPKLSQVVSANVAAPREFVAYANEAGEMDYGFCVRAGNTKLKVVSSSKGRAEVIQATQVASVLPTSALAIPRDAHNRIVASGISRDDVNQSIDYYTKLFSYAPEYLAQIKRMVEDTASM